MAYSLVVSSPYDSIAGEYYSASHKTSRNFDEATSSSLDSEPIAVAKDGLVLDVGCGRGRCGEFLNVAPGRVVQLDSSLEMLNLTDREQSLLRVWADATELPFLGCEFAVVAAFLCDAYLGLQFLAEANRVLSPGGRLVLTTPSLEWGEPLRAKLKLDIHETRFMRVDGGVEVRVPSYLYPVEQLGEMLIRVGFAADNIKSRRLRLPGTTEDISRDIFDPEGRDSSDPYALDILYLVTVTKD